MSSSAQVRGSYLTPAFQNARVSDAMRVGVRACPPDTPLETVARMMATHQIHCVVVTTSASATDGGQPWGIVSDLDLIGAASGAEDSTAGDVCATEVVTVEPDDSLERAAQLMVEHENAHLVVVDPTLRVPIGVISSLDLARAIAWSQA